MSSALAGIRVLDLADRSAALAGRVLADLGAEVIMVEPLEGSSIRRHLPLLDDVVAAEASFAHQYFSANKRSVTLDLREDRQRFLDLVASADVVIDTARPGVLDAHELGHDVLRSVQPGLVQCSVTPFGLHGEWSERKATDLVAGAAGGLVWLSGEPRGKPVQGGADVSYAMAGLIAASAITIALHQRAQSGSGTGAHLDISLQEAAAMAAMQTATPSQWTWFDRVPRRPGLSAALRCADGGYVGHLIRPDRFPAFLEWADREGIEHGMTVDDWRLSRLDAPRKDNPVAATTLALAAKLTRDEFAAGALEADLICLPVLGFDDLERTEQYVINDQFLTVPHAGIDRDLGFVRSPIDGMAAPVAISPAPMLGADQALLDAVEPVVVDSATGVDGAPSPDPARALAGLRVVDFGWVLAAPIGTRLLASFGAEVIRIESTKKPDSMRSQIGPDGVPDPELGGLFNVVNAGKKSFAVDLTTNDGMSLVRELIATADVVVNNFRPGAMDRMGFGFDELCALKDDIISLSLPGAHPQGPWAVRPSMGNILMAASGFNMLTGFEGERPRGIGIAYPDFTGPHLLTAAVLAAVRERDAGGGGQQISLTQLTGMVGLLGAEWMQYKATGEQPPRRANRDANYCPHGVFPTTGSDVSADEWVAIAVDGDDEWASLCALIRSDELASDPRFVSHAARKANEDALDEIVSTWSAAHDKWELAERLQAAGIAAAPVEHLDETYGRDPQLHHHYQVVRQPSRPDVEIPVNREAAQWVGHELILQRAPVVGEHNEEIVCGLLGRSAEDYASLIIRDVLG